MQKVFSLFGNKGNLSAQKRENTENSENSELHGNVYMTKSRSRAGSICQTRRPDLVVSALGSDTLLSSVFPIPA